MSTFALIFGILGGLFGLFVVFIVYLVVPGIAGWSGQSGARLVLLISFQLISIAIPIASLVGGCIAKSNATVAGVLMLLSAGGMLWLFGFNFFPFTAISVLSALGGALALFAHWRDRGKGAQN